jgi:homoaconitate hydratase
MGQTAVEKIAQQHMTAGPDDRPLRAGDVVTIRPTAVMTHDNTAAVMMKFAAMGVERILDPGQPVFALDHDIQNRSEANLAKYSSIETFAREQGVTFYPAGAGISHQLMVERGHVLPGSFVVASDSHANMYGALGALGTPVVRTDAAVIWATGEFWWQVPRTVQVELQGRLSPGVSAKDLIITLCGLYNRGEVLNAVVEFSGPGVAQLSVDGRMTVANMSTEWGALAAWFPADDLTRAYLQGLVEAGQLEVGALEQALARGWGPDDDAPCAARIEVDLAEISPHIAGPDTVQIMTPLPVLERQALAIQKAYLLSCVNSRYEDLAAAAEVLRGQTIAPGVTLYVAAASEAVQHKAEAAGIWGVFEAAGATFLPPGCGPCIGLGAGLLEPGEVGISATNRNFKGRMGSREARCYLGSPAVVASSALAGVICGADGASGKEVPVPIRRLHERSTKQAPPAAQAIVPGFPERIEGRLLFIPVDNLNTDGIYGKDYTYNEAMTPTMMAKVVMENYDPGFAERCHPGDIVVGGENFGTGSSREQAVTALQAAGISLVIAASFSQTYLRNAFNNGFLCLTSPALVHHLRSQHATRIEAGVLTLELSQLVVDFQQSVAHLDPQSFPFSPLGEVPQRLIAAGGVENQIREIRGDVPSS